MTTLERDRNTVAPSRNMEDGQLLRAKRQLKLPLAPSLEKRRLQAYLLLLLLDGLIIAGSLASVSLIYLGRADEPQTLQLLNLFVPLYWGAALLTRTFSIDALTSLRFSQSRSLLAIGIALALTIFTKSSEEFSRVSTLASLGMIAVGLVWVRSDLSGKASNHY